MNTSKVQDENAKIADAMKKRADAQRARRAAAAAAKKAASQAEEDRTRPIKRAKRNACAVCGGPEADHGIGYPNKHPFQTVRDLAKEKVAAGILGILDGTTTADEVLADPVVAAAVKAPRVRTVKHADGSTTDVDLTLRSPEEAETVAVVLQAEEVAKKKRAPRRTPEEKIAAGKAKVAARKAKAAKGPRVLPDPVANAKLVRMRAKWTAERRERDVARLEKAQEEGAKNAPALKAARADLDAAVQAERVAYAAYRELLAAAKNAKV